MEGLDVTNHDIPNAFIQAHVPESPDGERIVMKIWGILVDWLVELDRTVYLEDIVYRNWKKLLYVEIIRAIYGMIVARLLWYRKLRGELEEIGFVFNE